MTKNRLFIIVLIVGVVGISVLARSRMTSRTIVPSNEMPEEVEQKILSFDLANYAEDGTKKWQLKGDSADIFAEVVNLNNINMETYDDPKIFLTALRGAYDRGNKLISLYDDVVVVTSEGATLTTDYLKWNGNTDTITTDKPVRIQRSDVIANGLGAEAYPQMKKVILNKDVTVRLAKNVLKDLWKRRRRSINKFFYKVRAINSIGNF